ncbi:MAG: helix-turn-helix transcriptional regulator [Gammaproteobacteria bacterium]|nr:helix-turn-helix transcriptional regulator [Gammaproteobacteria bacterium]
MKELKKIKPRQEKKVLRETPNVAETVEAVFGCKWSLRILGLIREGINRPGTIEHALEGLTPKVQNYYFRRMMGLGILEKIIYAEVPPRVEYRLTSFGLRFMPVLDSIQELQRELEAHEKSKTAAEP